MARTLLPLDPGPLRDDDLRLVLVGCRRGDPAKGWVPSYLFEMHLAGHRGAVGHLNLRVGDTEHVVCYAGHIGYGVDPAWRGRHLARRSVALVLPFAARLGIDPVWITTNPDNAASIRTLERLGATRVDEVDVPAGTEMHARGETRKVRWRLDGGRAAPSSA